jgi:hypothetical protein
MRLRGSLAGLALLAGLSTPERAGAQVGKPAARPQGVPVEAVRVGERAVANRNFAQGVPLAPPPPVQADLSDWLWEDLPAAKAWHLAAVRGDQRMQYLLRQFRPLLQAELLLLERVCKPSGPQLDKIRQESEWALQAAAENVALAVSRGSRLGANSARLAYRDPSRLIEEGLVRIARTHLSPRQVESYRKEVEARDADQKRFAARNLVVLIDGPLYLSPDQRERIIGSLVAHWDDAWFLAVDPFFSGDQYLPELPGEYVKPFLTETQKTAWRALPRRATPHFGNFGFVGDLMIGD